MTYQEALRYLNSFVNYEKQYEYDYKKSFKIERMKRFASLLGNPQMAVKSIHIAGTKGKGSTCAILHSILKEAGYKVGLYTSPHLVSFQERIRIGDCLISEEDVCKLLDKIKYIIDKFKDDRPSFFEVYTALAYLYFKERRVDFAIYEVGLGGRLDATNVIEPLACAITPISYEHTDKLGNTLSQIASEKAGIIKENGICVLSPQEKEALAVIEDICKERKTKLIVVGRDIMFEELKATDEKETFSIFGLFNEYPILEMKLLGHHQVINAATAIGIIEGLSFHNIIIPFDAVKEGIAAAKWEGRLEVITRDPYLIIDGAQNRASAATLAKSIKKQFRYKKLILVLGVSKDKDINGILDELLPISDSIILTKSKVVERACAPSRIKELISAKDKEIILTSNVEEALDKARSKALTEDLVLVTGSLFVVGEARHILVNKVNVVV